VERSELFEEFKLFKWFEEEPWRHGEHGEALREVSVGGGSQLVISWARHDEHGCPSAGFSYE